MVETAAMATKLGGKNWFRLFREQGGEAPGRIQEPAVSGLLIGGA